MLYFLYFCFFGKRRGLILFSSLMSPLYDSYFLCRPVFLVLFVLVFSKMVYTFNPVSFMNPATFNFTLWPSLETSCFISWSLYILSCLNLHCHVQIFITFFLFHNNIFLMIKRVDVLLFIFVLIVSFLNAKQIPLVFLIWEYCIFLTS